MNLRYFQIFVQVYEQMNMSLVAEQMFLSQPAVSRTIKELEEHYSIRFFLRQNGHLIRTAGGTRFYQYAKELLACEEQLALAMEDQRQNRKVTLGISPTLAARHISPILRTYREECNELNIHLFSSRLETLEQMMLDSRMEIAIVEGQVSSWEITALPVFSEELVLVAAPGQGFEERKPLPLLVRDAGELERHRFAQVFRDAQIEYIVQGTFADVESIKACAQSGLGVGLIPRGCVTEQDGLEILTIPGIGLTAQYSLAFHNKRFLFNELVNLIDYLFIKLNGTAATVLYPQLGTK